MKIIKNKETKHALLSVVLFVTIIALYLELNVLINKINIKDIDATGQKLYSISEESKSKIEKIDKEINIELIDFDIYSDNIILNDATYVIEQYQQVNDKIRISKKRTEQIENSDLNPYIIISCGENEVMVSIYDLFVEKSYIEEGYSDLYYAIEEAITNNLCSVASDSKNTIYLYTEKLIFNESSLYTFAKRIQCLGFNVKILELSKEEVIPEDCNCVVIPPIKDDITENEKNALEQYINRGGNILFLEESKALTNVETPNFDEIRMLFGYEVDSGILLESKNHAAGNPGLIYVNVNKDNDIFNGVNNNYKISMIDATRIKLVNDEEMKNLNVTSKTIVSSGETSYIRYNLEDTGDTISETDEQANESMLGVYLNKKIGDKESKAIVFSNSLFATDRAIGVMDALTGNPSPVSMISIYDNEEVLTYSTRYLAQDNNSIISRKKYNNNIPSVKITKDGVTLKIIFGLPLIVLFVGYFVWRFRKYKK